MKAKNRKKTGTDLLLDFVAEEATKDLVPKPVKVSPLAGNHLITRDGQVYTRDSNGCLRKTQVLNKQQLLTVASEHPEAFAPIIRKKQKQQKDNV